MDNALHVWQKRVDTNQGLDLTDRMRSRAVSPPWIYA